MNCEGDTLLVTTVPGLEDLLAAEIKALCPPLMIAKASKGRVVAKAVGNLSARELHSLVTGLTLAEKVFLVLCEARVESLKDVERATLGCERLREILAAPLYYAVKASRVGVHGFSSLDIARVVGDAVGRLGARLAVSLDDPDVVIAAELVHGEFRIGVDLTPFRSLRERNYRAFVHPSMLNPIVARAMVRIAGVRGPATVLDPMCGSGTIPIEAMLEAPSIEAVGIDIDARYIAGARRNAERAGVSPCFAVGDANRIGRMFRPGSVDAVITNPPYGIRERAVGGIKRLYSNLVRGSQSVLREGGCLVLLTPFKRRVLGMCGEVGGLNAEEVRRLELGGLTTWVLKLRRG